jgi:hypothetical protein
MQSVNKEKMKLAFISRVGSLGDRKMHVLIPKEYHDIAMKMKKKRVKVLIDDEVI